MRRRQFVAIVTGSSSVPFLAGCAAVTGSEGADLIVRNRDSESHTFEITGDAGYESPPTTSGSLDPDGSKTVKNFLPYYDHGHSVTIEVVVDDTRVRETDVHIDTHVSQVQVDIVDSDAVEIGPDEIYSPTPPES